MAPLPQGAGHEKEPASPLQARLPAERSQEKHREKILLQRRLEPSWGHKSCVKALVARCELPDAQIPDL